MRSSPGKNKNSSAILPYRDISYEKDTRRTPSALARASLGKQPGGLVPGFADRKPSAAKSSGWGSSNLLIQPCNDTACLPPVSRAERSNLLIQPCNDTACLPPVSRAERSNRANVR